jgi:hypothetical protein
MYGYANNSNVNWKSATIASQKIYYLNDKELDLDELLHAQLPPIPLDANYTGIISLEFNTDSVNISFYLKSINYQSLK